MSLPAIPRRTRIKICGITRSGDALALARMGVDALGFVFYRPSPRFIEPAAAAEIIRQLPPLMTIVGLFVDADKDWLTQVLAEVPIDLLQFHGHESAQECQSFQRPYIKALRMRPGFDVEAVAQSYENARGLLLDSYRSGVPGGTGQVFDWTQVPTGLKTPIILAGGLNPGNIAEAIANVSPEAVDVSGGIENAPGCKDMAEAAALLAAVAAADEKHNSIIAGEGVSE